MSRPLVMLTLASTAGLSRQSGPLPTVLDAEGNDCDGRTVDEYFELTPPQ